MKHLPLAAALLVVSAAHAGVPSNPAFLGINMSDVPGACLVNSVTTDGAAAAAGVQSLDKILAIDGLQTANCQVLLDQVVARQPGDLVRLDIIRGAEHVTRYASLLTRSDVLQRRFVGHPFKSLDVTDPEDAGQLDLADLGGRTRVVALFQAEQCTDCDIVVRRVVSALDQRHGDDRPAQVLAVAAGRRDRIAQARLASKLGVPLAVADQSQFENLTLLDKDRAYFMVVDRRGIIRFVTPIATEGDDVDAEIDEVVAAADQAEHNRLRRR
jgi:hypothetical protein